MPFPVLCGAYQLSSATRALTALECLDDRLPVDIVAIKRDLLLVENPGCFQVLPGRSLIVLDVGYNPRAARALHHSLINLVFAGKRTAVFSILANKDTDGMFDIVKDQFGEWYIASLDVSRGTATEALVRKPSEHGTKNIRVLESIEKAYRTALKKAGENNRVVVLGSFYIAAVVMTALS